MPKPLRDRLGLRQGSDLELIETTDGVILRATTHQPALIRKNGWLLHTGKMPPGLDHMDAVGDDREDRIRKLAGL